ncbi:transcriptional regulator [Methylobacterium aquaticum]|uniref:transcriptional regulator n=1 Tax=Methylobacterium aquaticum TaxID=270351 RepID=UPI003D174A31
MSAGPLIQAAITLLGSEAKLGAACGVSQTTIWKAKRAKRVSAELAIRIENATNGAVARHRLRPDLWSPPVVPAASRPVAGASA